MIFGNYMYEVYNICNEFTTKEIIRKLTEYKQSKQITIVSKSEYGKTASDKLDEIYPRGWRLEE
jgi:hypothetical protein